MKRAWNRRLGVNILALVAIVAYFIYPTWGGPKFASTLLQVLPWAVGVGVLLLAVNRWFISRQTKDIRAGAAGGTSARGSH